MSPLSPVRALRLRRSTMYKILHDLPGRMLWSIKLILSEKQSVNRMFPANICSKVNNNMGEVFFNLILKSFIFWVG
jgi:hypothetical protein